MNMDKRDIGSQLSDGGGAGGGGSRGVAAGTGDNTEFNTGYVSRKGFSSCVVVIAGRATLAEGETLAVAGNLQDDVAGDGGAVNDFGSALAATVVATGPAGGGTVGFCKKVAFDLSGADEYIRYQCTPNLSASGTDTFDIGVGIILGGADETPAA